MQIIRKYWRRLVAAVGILVLLGAGTGLLVWYKFFRVVEQPAFASEEEFFKYGSVRSELLLGLPYPLFVTLPRVFPDLLPGPGGFAAFGLPWEEGKPLPVGLSLKTLGFPRVTINCAFCHTTSYRETADDPPTYVVGGPTHTLRLQKLLRFLFAAANDPRFTSTRLMIEMSMDFDMSLLDRALYYFFIIPFTREAIQQAEKQFAWIDKRPDWGPGRDDPFNLVKFILNQQPDDDTSGNSDIPAIWRLDDRDGQALHLSGEALTPNAVVTLSAVGIASLPFKDFKDRNARIEAYLRKLQPPAYPFGVDADLAARGGELFAANCADCHAAGGSRVGTVIPLDEIGTDPGRSDSFDTDDAERANRRFRLLGVDDSEFTAASGYVARPLSGVWLLAPYLHNGSVPHLRALLSPPAERPRSFYRGHDVYDQTNIGFASGADTAAAGAWRYDVDVRGNSNAGHVFGTTLSADEKAALIEYLKTL